MGAARHGRHPDRTKHPDKEYANDLFTKYANAYEVLSNSEMRKNYDYVLDHPYEFPMQHMRMNTAKYAAKTDLRTVFLLVIAAVSAIHYYYQLQEVKQRAEGMKAAARFEPRACPRRAFGWPMLRRAILSRAEQPALPGAHPGHNG